MALGIDDVEGYAAALERAFGRLQYQLELTLGIAGRPPTLVLNLPTPQRAMLGRTLPRFDIREPGHFIERLNGRLVELLPDYPDAHLFDLDQLSGAFGRRAVQDDAFWSVAHGGWITDYDFPLDADRLEPVGPLSALHRFDVDTFVRVA